MRRLQGLYILNRDIYDLVYGPEVRQAIARHVEIIAPPHTGASLAQRRDLLNKVEVNFSGWGGPCLDERFVDQAPNLRAVFHAGGAPRLPANAARRGIVITSAHVANSVPVAEYTLAIILLSLKHAWHLIHRTRQEQTFPERNGGPGCYQKTIGIIGLGTIARLLLPLLKPFELRVVAYDPFVTPAEAAAADVEMVSLEDVFDRSDVVTLHAAHTRATEGMITGRYLASMRPGTTFINSARGMLVRETELMYANDNRGSLPPMAQSQNNGTSMNRPTIFPGGGEGYLTKYLSLPGRDPSTSFTYGRIPSVKLYACPELEVTVADTTLRWSVYSYRYNSVLGGQDAVQWKVGLASAHLYTPWKLTRIRQPSNVALFTEGNATSGATDPRVMGLVTEPAVNKPANTYGHNPRYGFWQHLRKSTGKYYSYWNNSNNNTA